MRKLLVASLLVLVCASFAQFGAVDLSSSTMNTSAYEATVSKAEQIKSEMESVTYQVDQARDFLVVLFGDHGMADPFEEKVSSGDKDTLKSSVSAAEEAQANEHLGNITDLPATIEDLMKQVSELLPTAVENLKDIAGDISNNPTQAATLQATQSDLDEAKTNLEEAVAMLPMVKADVEAISTILGAIL